MSPTSLTPPPPPVIQQMDPEKKGWWADALESDRFRKGQGALRAIHEDGLTYHCCLGVLCEVAIEHGLDLAITYSSDRVQTYFDGEALLLPKSVVQWAGLEKEGPEVWQDNGEGVYKVELTLLNDDTEDTFADIAARIRADL